MLALTKKAEYALVAICHLVHTSNQIVSAREIAEAHDVPLPLLMNVLKRLVGAGWVDSVRGARGGYQLVAAPERVTLAEVLEVIDGPIQFVDCAASPANQAQNGGGCRRSDRCALRRPMVRIHKRLVELLRGITMADLAHDRDYRAGLTRVTSGRTGTR